VMRTALRHLVGCVFNAGRSRGCLIVLAQPSQSRLSQPQMRLRL
jgi:hypothetical protein